MTLSMSATPQDAVPQNSSTTAMAAKPKVNLDWTRDPPPSNLTAFQRFVRNIDWSSTDFGPMGSWHPSLRQTVRMVMAEIDPVILYWGGSNAMIYNEAYVPLVGQMHPRQLGMRAYDAYPGFWDFFENIIREQRETGETCTGEASMLFMERREFLEETYFSWKLVPIIGESGEVLGSYGRPSEKTAGILSARRTACTLELAQCVKTAKDHTDLWRCTISALAACDKDLPMIMIYSMQHTTSTVEGSPPRSSSVCHLVDAVGLPENQASVKIEFDLQQDTSGFAPAMLSSWNSHEITIVTADDPHIAGLFDRIEWRGFGVPCREYVVLPVVTDSMVNALLVLGLNPRLQLDRPFESFVRSIGGILTPELSRLRLTEEVRQRTVAAKMATLEFEKSEMKFSRFAERSPVGLSLTDEYGQVLYTNEAWRNFMGVDGQTAQTGTWVDAVFEDDVPTIQEWWHKVTTFRESVTFQFRSKMPFESRSMRSANRTAICAAYPEFDDTGHVINVMAILLDISEQKWIEEQLRMGKQRLEVSEHKYRNLAEGSPHGVVRTDEHGNIKFANAAWHEFYNFEPGNIEGAQPWLRELEESEKPGVIAYFESVQTTTTPTSIEFRKKQRTKTADGKRGPYKELWLLATGWAESRPDGGKDIMFWVTDITAQKLATKILEDKMEEAIRLKTQQERFIDMISHEIRNPLSAVLHCGEEIADSMKRCLTAMDILPSPDTLEPKEGALQTLTRNEINSALDAANTIMYCVQHQKQIVDDVLTLSKLDSDLLVVSPVPVEPAELVRSALKIFEPETKSADIRLQLETDISVREMNADWIMLDPNRFLQIVINLVTNAIKFTRASKTRDIVIRVTARESRPPQLHEGIRYVPRRDIPRNAANHVTDNGLDRRFTGEVYLCFSVADTGKGLTEDERILLFNRFAQASPKTHVEYGGSGLGLFISRQITEMLGGEIGVGTGPSGGCTFAFYVRTCRTPPPRRSSLGVETISAYTKTLVQPTPGTWVGASELEALRAKKEGKRPQLPTPEPTTRKRRVLVVEDNLINQRVLCKQLRGRGFLVEAANHGREALAALEADNDREATNDKPRFSVILCDIEMPVMNGIDCVAEIRRLECEGRFPGHIPIIGVTANVRSKQVNLAIEVGMDGVTTKPYRIDELIAHIDRVCLDTKMLKPPGGFEAPG